MALLRIGEMHILEAIMLPVFIVMESAAPTYLIWKREAVTIQTKIVPSAKTDVSKNRSLDYTISLKCSGSRLPTKARAESQLQIYIVLGELYDGNDGSKNNFLGDEFFMPGDRSIDLSGGFGSAAEICKMVNYGTEYISQVTIPFYIELRKKVTSGNKIFAGDLIASKLLPVSNLDLSPPPGQSDFFYFASARQDFALVRLPDSVSIRLAGSEAQQNVKLIKSDNLLDAGFAIYPRDFPTPSTTAPLPAPAPQKRLGKKPPKAAPG